MAIPSSTINLNDDRINEAIVQGIKDALYADLKEVLMPAAEKAVDEVVKNLVARFEVKLREDPKVFGDAYRRVKLEFLLKKEGKK
jgi:hypothetical protein